MAQPAPPTHASAPATAASSTDAEFPFRYGAALANVIERRWQECWAASQTFRTPNPGEPDFDPRKPKFYVLDMFPYPSGAGLHVGHPIGYIATDVVARFKRMQGFNVLHPMGWDAFGLPAEQYAIQTGVHPAVTTRKAIDTFRAQLQRLGFSYDWTRELATIDPDYYRWTQWIFLRLYDAWYDHAANRARPIRELIDELDRGVRLPAINPHASEVPAAEKARRFGPWKTLSPSDQRAVIDSHRLAYLAEQMVNWCPKLGTVLANEEVIDGRSERGGHPVFRLPLKQWMFRITAYAERLLTDLEPLKWPESTRTMQREWIGRSEGAEVEFPLAKPCSGVKSLRVFTTRPDTIFGATYMVVAPEHPLVAALLAERPERDAERCAIPDRATIDALRAYVEQARNRADMDRLADTREKTGVFTGVHAVNPATGQCIPVWTSDYVLMGYGHGAIMAVPAHDDRDFEFARTFGLPIRDVVHNRLLGAIAAGCRPHLEGRDTPGDWPNLMVDFVGICLSEGRTDYENIWSEARSRAEQAIASPQVKPSGEGDIDAILRTPLKQAGEGANPDPAQARLIAMVWYETLMDAAHGDFDALARASVEGRLIDLLGHPVTEDGVAVNSANDEVSLNGLPTSHAKRRIVEWLERTGRGSRKVNFKLRDWLFSRQRYWGEPFPIVFDAQGNHYPVSDAALPVRLPDMADYEPIESDRPTPPLGKATNWVKTTAGEAGVDPALLPPDTPVTRETNTMPGWAGSCWYYLRFCDPRNDTRFVGPEAERYWMVSRKGEASRDQGIEGSRREGGEAWDASTHHVGGVDLYVGGAEHAVLHLLYARFWHKALFDLGFVSTPEPIGRLFHQGLLVSHAYQRDDKTLVPIDEVEERGEGVFIERATGRPVTPIIAKMSKSLRNVVVPDDVVAEYGADTFRLYEMSMGPLEASKPWNTRDIIGPFRFLQRAWRLMVDEKTGAIALRGGDPDPTVEKQLHRTIAKIGPDIDKLSMNTAIAALIEFVNVATSAAGPGGGSGGGGGVLTHHQAERFVTLLAPLAPHMAEELWSKLGHAKSIAHAPWPAFDPAMLVDDEVEIAVQVMGKVRARLMVPTGSDEKAIERIAMADPKVKVLLEDKTIRKVFVVPGRLINFVAQ